MRLINIETTEQQRCARMLHNTNKDLRTTTLELKGNAGTFSFTFVFCLQILHFIKNYCNILLYFMVFFLLVGLPETVC